MSRSTVRTASADQPISNPSSDSQTKEKISKRVMLGDYALAGLVAALLLSAVEWIDLQIQLTSVFASFSERLIFSAYFSLNLVVGAVIGLIVGVSALAAKWAYAKLMGLMTRGKQARLIHRLASFTLIVLIAAALLYLQPSIHRYALGLIREAEKIPRLTTRLLRYESLFVYLLIAGGLVAFWALSFIARATRWMRPALCYVWILSLILIASIAYYVDSRIEVQLYEPSLHRTMFVVTFALSMTLIATLHNSLPRLNRASSNDASSVAGSSRNRFIASSLALIIIASAIFTFIYFDHNHNLKTQLFFRSTQSKQFFSLVQYALDFDRDSYSALLGGGDADDFNSAINPARAEIAGDSVDNNGIGGDISQSDVEQWLAEHQRLNSVANDAARVYNVIFIFVDTVRADHLSLYGYGRNTSPNLSKLAERSAVFENAFTPAPYTFEAMPKFMKSSYWDARVETWTEVLARSGYETIMFPRRTSTMLRYVKGMNRVVRDGTKGLKETIDATINVLGAEPQTRPFAAFVYVADPHMPYQRRKEFDFGSSLTDLYDGELAYTDHHLGRLFDWLYESGKINDTIIAIMSDHGESLGERAVYKHTSQLYNEQARVPMIVHIPGFAPRRVNQYVSTVDLGSTILNAVGIAPPKEYTGTSLIPLIRGDSFTRLPVYSEQTLTQDSRYVPLAHYIYPDTKKYMVVTQDGYKMIYNREAYSFELFNLKDDPKELRNLYDSMPEKASEMKKLLGRFVDVVSISRPPDADEKKYNLRLKKVNSE